MGTAKFKLGLANVTFHEFDKTFHFTSKNTTTERWTNWHFAIIFDRLTFMLRRHDTQHDDI